MTDTTRYLADVVLEMTDTGELTLHHAGGVDVAEGRVIAVGAADDLGPPPEGTEIMDLGGLLMPGLVNTHCHAPMVLFRSAGDGYPLDRWLREVVWPREGHLNADDVRVAMLAGSAEMLLAGVTTSVEMYLFDEAIFDAVAVTGARLVSTPGVISAIHGADLDARLAQIAQFHAQYHRPDSRVSVGIGPHSCYDLSAAMLAEVGAMAADLDTLVHIHLEETEAERDLVRHREAKSATQLLYDQGVLANRLIAGHGVWLDAGDRRILAEAGASVAHCPSSNLKLGSGFADVRTLLDAGVNVAVATDGAASADSLDLWNGIRLAPGLARALHTDPMALSVADTLRMATVNGGRAIGRPDVGTLAPGSRADFIRIDIDGPLFAPATDDHELLTHLVFNNSARHVTDVWVDGEAVVRDGRCAHVDLEQLSHDLGRRARRILAEIS